MRNEIVWLENSVYCSAFCVLNVKGMLHDDELIAEWANCELWTVNGFGRKILLLIYIFVWALVLLRGLKGVKD